MNITCPSRSLSTSLTSNNTRFSISDNNDGNHHEEEFQYSDAFFPDCDYLYFVDKLSETKFPVYLVYCRKTSQLYAIKLFYWEDDTPSLYYNREVRSSTVVHPNIIKIFDHKEEQDLFESDVDPIKVSYVLMEYAKYGDFFDALVTRRILFNEILLRTYFHQLIQGIEALHSKGVAHLDLKLENLLIGDDYLLKIADFDVSFMSEDGRITSRGTKNCRAPEIVHRTCKDPYAADIYSAGIILFLLKTRGIITFTEAEGLRDLGLSNLTRSKAMLYWNRKCEILGEEASFFSEGFKELFMKMIRSEPNERATIDEIKKSSWYNMEIYSQRQLKEYMSSKFGF